MTEPHCAVRDSWRPRIWPRQLTAEADRRTRDAFGRLSEADPERYASAWLATAVHLASTERALVQATWQAACRTGEIT
ncbi:hypothetical protein [Streptomyces sp. SP17KL33]|uniref:hypothetical protein n=1 Tax=unclassified Streptomyces TaxID=2593676 RepID=UPI002E75E1C7|nr:hypothetical protein [Streptomyces sp. SP17KL33]MEE1836809.1 hypothetical protein [Streptomyces sp. SP17KL33]